MNSLNDYTEINLVDQALTLLIFREIVFFIIQQKYPGHESLGMGSSSTAFYTDLSSVSH